MAYIYCITNNVNNKHYIGKTERSIEKRFQEHINNKNRREFEIRPLYRAFKKYGVENFSIELLEKCSVEESSDREIYWIDKLDTYHNGYNATLGGDGKVLYDYKELADKYLELQSLIKTAQYFNCDVKTVKTACDIYNIDILSSFEVEKIQYGKKVKQFDKQDHSIFIQEYSSIKDAARSMVEQHYSNSFNSAKTHISQVCHGKRKSSCSFYWQFV